MITNRLSIIASALGTDPRLIPRAARQLGFAGLVFDVFGANLNIAELSQSGRREFLHLLSSENQPLVGLQLDLDPKGLGPGADVDRQIDRLELAMESAAGFPSPMVLVDVGPLPQPALVEISAPAIPKDKLGALILPEPAALRMARPVQPPDPKFVSQINAALSEIAVRAERYSVAVTFSSSLASFAAIASALADARCHWFGLDLDSSAMVRDDWNADQIFSSLGPQIGHVRARDAVSGANKRAKPAIIGQGSVDWPRLLGQLDEAGYQGFVTIDPTELSDRRAAAIAGRQYLGDLVR